MRNNCVAISQEDEGCKLCYNSSSIPSSVIRLHPETTYVKRIALDALNDCTPYSCIAPGASCVDRNGTFECECPTGTMGNDCSVCDVLYQESCYNMVFTPKNCTDASDYCSFEGGHLVDISDDEEYQAVFNTELVVWRHGAFPLISGTTYNVQDGDLTASGEFSSNHDASQSRLNTLPTPGVTNSGAWCVRDNPTPIWIQVKLGRVFHILKIATQGLPSAETESDRFWVKTYKVQYSLDTNNFQTVQNGSEGDLIFHGNMNKDEIKYNDIPGIVIAKYVRLVPETWNENICLRWELYGYHGHIWTDGIYHLHSQSWRWSTLGSDLDYPNYYNNPLHHTPRQTNCKGLLFAPNPHCLPSLHRCYRRKLLPTLRIRPLESSQTATAQTVERPAGFRTW